MHGGVPGLAASPHGRAAGAEEAWLHQPQRRGATGDEGVTGPRAVLEVELPQHLLDRREHRSLQHPQLGARPRVDVEQGQLGEHRPRLPAGLLRAVDGVLDTMSARFRDVTALTVVIAARGYPGKVETGAAIQGLDAAAALEDVMVFQAGTRRAGGQLVASGGRVLNVTACGATLETARHRAYQAVERITLPGGFFRRDIGKHSL